ncbi:unnamed protein product [Onchocerca flexuosa]|uniref:Uncharacterized protein n=1 Tax=Onchocerca flexuosa TaxID=387005 RepID=A0A183HHQ1_9BILA|nr:unnamed protein product [Onchocerca flexuosa]
MNHFGLFQTSNEAEMVDHLKQENFTTQLSLLKTNQHQKFASSTRNKTDNSKKNERTKNSSNMILCNKQFEIY